MKAEYYSEYRIGKTALPYRIRRSAVPPDEDGAIVWLLEYQQDTSGRWDPRGTAYQRGDAFEYGGRTYNHPSEVLEARIQAGP